MGGVGEGGKQILIKVKTYKNNQTSKIQEFYFLKNGTTVL